MMALNGSGMGLGQIYRMAARAPRAPFPGQPGVTYPGGPATVWVYDEKGLAVPMAEVYLVKVERGTMDVREQLGGARTDYLGKVTFHLPSYEADEVLLFLVEKAGYARASVTARPRVTARVTLVKESGAFRPEEVVLRERVLDMGELGEIADEEFLTKLALETRMLPQEAGSLAAKWRDGRLDEFAKFVALKAGFDAAQTATLRTLVAARDKEAILKLAKENGTSFFLKPMFLIPAGFFVVGAALAAARRR